MKKILETKKEEEKTQIYSDSSQRAQRVIEPS